MKEIHAFLLLFGAATKTKGIQHFIEILIQREDPVLLPPFDIVCLYRTFICSRSKLVQVHPVHQAQHPSHLVGLLDGVVPQ